MKNAILVLGAGAMGKAIINGCLAQFSVIGKVTIVDPADSVATAFNDDRVKHVTSPFMIDRHEHFDAIVVAVKPQNADDAIAEAVDAVGARLGASVVISIMAGVTTSQIKEVTGADIPVVRCMPNLAAIAGESPNVAFSSSDCGEEERQLFERLFSGSGPVFWVEDEMVMNAVTAVSGSGPAYFFRVVSAIERAGVNMGLDASLSRSLAIQTIAGSAAVLKSDPDPQSWCERVASKGGTTEAALEKLDQAPSLEHLIETAMKAAYLRGCEIARRLEEAD